MSQIFISYKREERDVAKNLAKLLISIGYEVWWDAELLPGDQYADEIQRVIDSADAAIVLWSRKSVQSRFVKAEAQRALQHNILVPLNIDEADIPIPFNGLHTLDFSNWSGDPEDQIFIDLTQYLKKSISLPAHDPSPEYEVNKRINNAEATWKNLWSAVRDLKPESVTEYRSFLEAYGDNVDPEIAAFINRRVAVIKRKQKKETWTKFGVALVSLVAVAAGGIQILSAVYPDYELFGSSPDAVSVETYGEVSTPVITPEAKYGSENADIALSEPHKEQDLSGGNNTASVDLDAHMKDFNASSPTSSENDSKGEQNRSFLESLPKISASDSETNKIETQQAEEDAPKENAATQSNLDVARDTIESQSSGFGSAGEASPRNTEKNNNSPSEADTVRPIQNLLASMKCPAGPVDGIMGRKTINALLFVNDYVAVPDISAPTQRTVEKLRKLADDKFDCQKKLEPLEIAEALSALGKMHAYRTTCNGRNDQYYRSYALAILQNYRTKPVVAGKSILIDIFNEGFASALRKHETCSATVVSEEQAFAENSLLRIEHFAVLDFPQTVDVKINHAILLSGKYASKPDTTSIEAAPASPANNIDDCATQSNEDCYNMALAQITGLEETPIVRRHIKWLRLKLAA